jgi:hypothetical protein
LATLVDGVVRRRQQCALYDFHGAFVGFVERNGCKPSPFVAKGGAESRPADAG